MMSKTHILPLSEALQSLHPLQALNIELPQHFACFSKVKGELKFGAEAGRPPNYVPQHPPLNLNDGLSTFKPVDDVVVGGIRHVIDAAAHSGFTDWKTVDFVTYRNNLNKILETPYNTQNWKIELHRVGDVVVMDVRKGEFLSQSTPQSLKMQYWGHKFEACCGGSDVVDVESEWCSVYRTSLGTHRLLVSAEIDCEEKLANGTRAFVEVKTSGSMQTAESRCNFRERKLIKYWIQSYVAGVPTVVVGYRSEDGVLTGIDRFNTLEIPSYVPSGIWDCNRCLQFANALFTFIRLNTVAGMRYTLAYNSEQQTVILSSSEEPHPWLTEKYTQLLQWHNVWTGVTPVAVTPSSSA